MAVQSGLQAAQVGLQLGPDLRDLRFNFSNLRSDGGDLAFQFRLDFGQVRFGGNIAADRVADGDQRGFVLSLS